MRRRKPEPCPQCFGPATFEYDEPPERPKWEVERTCDGVNTVKVDGQDVTRSVRSLDLEIGNRNQPPSLTLEVVSVGEVRVVGQSEPRWVGLERVSDPALVAELESRGWMVSSGGPSGS